MSRIILDPNGKAVEVIQGRASLPSRSSAYQHLIQERTGISAHVFEQASDLSTKTPEDHQRDELRDQLLMALRRLALRLTQHQQTVFNLWLEGHTQMEIAKMMGGKNQSNIAKVLRGNTIYYEDNTTERRGGIFPKLKRLSAEDPEVQAILKQLEGNE